MNGDQNQNPWMNWQPNWYSQPWANYQGSQPTDPTGGFTIPTTTEAYNWASMLPGMQAQQGMLGMMSSPQGFQQSIMPMMQDLMKGIGRTGLPSSSYSDRIISNTLGSLFYQNALNTASGWQNYMGSLAPYAAGYMQWPMQVMGQIGGGVG